MRSAATPTDALRRNRYVSTGMVIGMAIGAILGSATDRMGEAISAGIGFGILGGAIFSRFRG